MARIRTIKPELFHHADLYDAEVETNLPLRLAWAGLFTACDREGRFKWKARELKAAILPYDDIDFSRVLDAWLTRGFVVKYVVDGKEYGYVPTWHTHQSINNRESASTLPDPAVTREGRVPDASLGEGKGKEGKGRELASREPTLFVPTLSDKARMVANRVRCEAPLSGMHVDIALEATARHEIANGVPEDDVGEAMLEAWRTYTASRGNLKITWGAEKFFGEGHWKDKAAWPWKDGQAPKPAAKRKSAEELIAEQEGK